MSEQAQGFDNWDTAEQLAQLSDVVREGGQVTAQQVQQVLARLQSGGQPDSGQPPAPGDQALAGDAFGSGGSSTLAGGVLPLPELEPFPIDRLGERVDQVGRQVATLDERDRTDVLYAFTEQINRSLDQAAGERPHPLDDGYRRAPATSDQELHALAGRIDPAALDPAGHTPDQLYGLVEELNATIGHISREHERQVDEFEARRQAAERQRQAKARAENDTARTLRALAGQLDGAAAPGR